MKYSFTSQFNKIRNNSNINNSKIAVVVAVGSLMLHSQALAADATPYVETNRIYEVRDTGRIYSLFQCNSVKLQWYSYVETAFYTIGQLANI